MTVSSKPKYLKLTWVFQKGMWNTSELVFHPCFPRLHRKELSGTMHDTRCIPLVWKVIGRQKASLVVATHHGCVRINSYMPDTHKGWILVCLQEVKMMIKYKTWNLPKCFLSLCVQNIQSSSSKQLQTISLCIYRLSTLLENRFQNAVGNVLKTFR